MYNIQERKATRVRSALKALRTASEEHKVQASTLMAMWLEDATPSNFDQLMRPFNSFLASCSPDMPRLNRLVWPLMAKWLSMGEFVADAECARLLKQIRPIGEEQGYM